MSDVSGLMEPFSVTHMPETLHIMFYLLMTGRCAAVDSLYCIFHDVLPAEDAKKGYFFSTLKEDGSYCHVSLRARDME